MEKNSSDQSEQNSGGHPLIELSEVDVASSQDPAMVRIEGIVWRVNAGDFWIVGGARGAGKSDLVATAAGLQPPLRGTVRLFGREISGLKDDDFVGERKRIGVVFKSGGRIFSHLTVIENVALPLRYHHNLSAAQSQEPVEKLLELTGLTEFAHSTLGTLSNISKQRVGLARTLVLEPEVLFLDEPLSGLEPREQKWWLEFLEKFLAGTLPLRSPTAMVITATDFQPWLERGKQFAVIKNKRWRVLGGRTELERAAELVNEAIEQ